MRAKERFVKIFVLLVFLAGLIYSSLWFYKADVAKRTLRAELKSIQEFDVGSFRFGKINITGFPFSFDIEIIGLQLSINQDFAATKGNVPYTRFSLPKLLVHSDIAGNTYTLEPVGNIHLQNPRQKHATLLLKSPILYLHLPRSSWRDALSGDIIFDRICSFQYEDQGFDIISDDSGKSIFSGNGTTITSDCDGKKHQKHINFRIASLLERGEGFSDFAGYTLASKHLDVTINTTATLKKTKGIATHYVELAVQKALFSLDDASIAIKGTFNGSTLLFYSPDADINLAFSIKNYSTLFDASVMNGWITKEDRSVLEKLLPDIANTMDAKNLMINIKLSPGSNSLHIGNMRFSDAVAAFNGHLKTITNHTDEP